MSSKNESHSIEVCKSLNKKTSMGYGDNYYDLKKFKHIETQILNNISSLLNNITCDYITNDLSQKLSHLSDPVGVRFTSNTSDMLVLLKYAKNQIYKNRKNSLSS
jgi:hypothetical protein